MLLVAVGMSGTPAEFTFSITLTEDRSWWFADHLTTPNLLTFVGIRLLIRTTRNWSPLALSQTIPSAGFRYDLGLNARRRR